MSLWPFVVLLLSGLVAGTVFFSVNLIALRTFSRGRLLEVFRSEGRTFEQANHRTEEVVANTEKLIVACNWYLVLSRTSTLVLLIVVSNWRFANRPIVGYGLALGAAMFLQSIFAMAIPHAWAKYAGERTLMRTYRILLWMAVGAAPLLHVQRWYDDLIRRLAGVPEVSAEQQEDEKQEEFLTELEHHRLEGAVDEEEQEMIENVLELSEQTADEVMTPRTEIVAVEVGKDLRTVLDTISKAGFSRLPVYEDNIDNIVGMIYAKDLLTEIGLDPAAFRLRDKLRQAFFVPESKPIRSLLQEFKRQKLHIAVVLDEYGGTAGIVTMEDVIEELVGEISDEYEQAPADTIRQVSADHYELDARTTVDDLNDRLELGLPEGEDYDTVAGFLFSRCGYIPKAGEVFEHENLRFTILAAEPRRIKRLRIQRVQRPSPSGES